MIRCENVSLSFGSKSVLSDVSIAVRKGEKLCLAGVSGRGKSSLLRLIQAYLPLDKGTVYIDGEQIKANNIDALREKIAWVPQNVNLPVEHGKELLELMQIEDKQAQVETYMQALDLPPEILEQSFNSISGGQKQRLIIAVCLSLHRPILIMDEPTASLDEASIEGLIRLLQQFKDLTVLSSSHNNTWLKRVDRVIQL